jgi:hypothetical protein
MKILSLLLTIITFSFSMEGEKKTPFPLLAKFDPKAIRYVSESRYHVLEEGETAIVGPLNPCIFVGIKNPETGKTIVFHKMYSNALSSMKDIVKKEFPILATLECVMFGTKISNSDNDEQTRLVNSELDIPLFKITGKTVKQDIKHTKDELIEWGIPKDKIHAFIWRLSEEHCKNDKYLQYQNTHLKGFEQAELYVACPSDQHKNLKDILRSVDLQDSFDVLKEKKKSIQAYDKETSLEIEEWQKKCEEDPSTSNEFSQFYPIKKPTA